MHLNRTEIADLIGLSAETVSRCFTMLRKMRVIELPRPQEVRILKREILQAIGYAPERLPSKWQLLLKDLH